MGFGCPDKNVGPSRQNNTAIGRLYFDNKKGGHGQQLFRILLKVMFNNLNMQPIRAYFTSSKSASGLLRLQGRHHQAAGQPDPGLPGHT